MQAAASLARSTLGRQAIEASPWQFVPAGAAKLASMQGDEASQPQPGSPHEELHACLALSLLRLGLKTIALEHLASLCKGSHPALKPLHDAASACTSDEVSLAARQGVLTANLRALRAPLALGLEDADSVATAWAARQARVRAFRTTSGVVVLRDEQGWSLFMDDHGAGELLASGQPKNGPFYVDGFHAPHALQRLFDLTRRPHGEVQCRLVMLAASVDEALTNLSLADWTRLLSSECVEAWAHADCPKRVFAEATSRLACTLGWSIALPFTRQQSGRWHKGAISEAIMLAGSMQEQEVLARRTSTTHWARGQQRDLRGTRLREAGLRILLPTTRYSTFVQHAASDLAHSLRAMGYAARVLIEPDAHSIHTELAILRVVDEWRPDLVVCINTLRPQLAGLPKEGLPVVTWVQDAMAHLFDHRMGEALTPLDFIVGHLHEELHHSLRVPARRTLASPVLASETKFHASPIHATSHAQNACDIAYISHQWQTPEQLADAKLQQAPPTSPLQRAIPFVLARVPALVEGATIHAAPLAPALQALAEEALAQTLPGGTLASPAMRGEFLHQVVHPLAERAMRHQMLRWAQDLAHREKLRLHIYGKGWDKHPQFAEHARGEVAHDDSLRAAYQSATLQLHAGLGGIFHQRVMECALSGSCTLVRIKRDDLNWLGWWAQNQTSKHTPREHFRTLQRDGNTWYLSPTADHPEAMLVQTLFDSLGLGPQHDQTGWHAVSSRQLDEAAMRADMPMEAAWLAGDIRDSGFWDAPSFERAVRGVLGSATRREGLSRWQRDATKQHYSLGAFARRIIEMVARELDHCQQPEELPTIAGNPSQPGASAMSRSG